MFDVIIIGGGPAGLNAALVLGRARRSVLIIDQGNPRNAHAHEMHGFLSRDGFQPLALLKIGRREVRKYDVDIYDGEAIGAIRRGDRFTVRTHDRKTFSSRKLLLATGVRDQLPRIDGFPDFYGKSIHHCPYCDAWEWRDKRIAAYGTDRKAIGLALLLRNWTDQVIVLTDGARLPPSHLRHLCARHEIGVDRRKIARLVGAKGRVKRVVFEDGADLAIDALFFNTGQRQKSELAEKLGCEFDRKGGVIVDKRSRTCVPGLFLCGDASKDVQFVINAAAEGAAAAVTINKEFQEEEGRLL
jgi:thioredoxin reductase